MLRLPPVFQPSVPMNYKQIEAFRAVMLTRSMTEAAAQLHTSQPNISRVIGQLEREAGFRLFERVGNRLAPTDEATRPCSWMWSVPSSAWTACAHRPARFVTRAWARCASARCRRLR